jgi:hypothetical protein
MRLTATFELPDLNIAKYLDSLGQIMRDAVKEGARVWLRSAIATIPIWFGSSQETLRPLATRVGLPLVISPRAEWTEFSSALE